MEVLVLVANGSADALYAAVMSALKASQIDALTSLPPHPAELQADQVIVSRLHLDRDGVAAIVGNKSIENIDSRPSSANPNPAEASTANTSTENSDLLRKIGRKSKKIKFLSQQVNSFRAQAHDAIQKAQHLELEQEQFFDDVREMKTQHDKLAENHRKLMWEYLPARDPSLRAIPRMSTQLPETATAVGKYQLEQVLGYGQYAVVYSSSTPEHPHLAIKAIDKHKLVDLVSLHRISSEIASLSDPAIRHEGILQLIDVIHTRKHVYLVTERGGKDLFEFFGAPLEGLPEDTIRPLLQHVAQAVQVLHRHNYCHRDLKPENILYSPGSAQSVKIIDFGLCTKAASEQDHTLRDFCGSPGFFAPEVLLLGSYDGLQVDVWSIGCILLELVLGNTQFSSLWMSVYELSILKDHAKFSESIQAALTRVREFCHSPDWKYSTRLRAVLLGMLCENPSGRLTIDQVLEHAWLAGDTPLPRSGPPAEPRELSPVKSMSAARSHGPTLTTEPQRPEPPQNGHAVHPHPEHSSRAAHTPLVSSRSHHQLQLSPHTVKVSLPCLSPDKPLSRSPERTATKTPDKRNSSHS